MRAIRQRAELGSRPLSLWSAEYVRTTVGVFALMFLFAFEALAVATVMPEVAEELDGLAWYAVAFAAPIVASVLALVVAGPSVDKRGPGPVMSVGLVVFVVGVMVAGLAPNMSIFIAGRLLHGLGAGILGVTLYVVVAQVYPEHLRPKAFALLTMAWVLPALVGPVLAAGVAHAFGWRWVFLGVPVIAVGSWLLVRGAPSRPGVPDGAPMRIGAALAAAAGVFAVSLAGQREVAVWPLLAVAGVLAIVLGGRRLLPPGSWSGGRGLASVLGTRGLVGTGFAAAEVYVPLLLTLGRGLSLAQAGWVLTVGAVTWSGGATVAAHWSALEDEVARTRIGTVLLGIGIGGFCTAAIDGVPLVVPVICWGVAGLGIGMAFSTLSVLALATADEGGEGRASSALQLNDYLLQSAGLAVGSVVFAGFVDDDPVAGATILIGTAGVVGLLALLPAARLRPSSR